jgi:hypothetical protein
MRLLPCFLLAAFTGSWAAAEVSLVRVWPGYRASETFVGIREYFGGDEPNGGRTTLRSQPDERGGYYWLIRARSSEPVPEAVVEVQFIRPGRSESETRLFTCSLPEGSRAILIGLTGSDWPDAKARPTAWKVRLLDPAGNVLAAEESFLWSAPPASPPARP